MKDLSLRCNPQGKDSKCWRIFRGQARYFLDHNTGGFLDLCDVMPLPMGTLLEKGVVITMATEQKHKEECGRRRKW